MLTRIEFNQERAEFNLQEMKEQMMAKVDANWEEMKAIHDKMHRHQEKMEVSIHYIRSELEETIHH
jgi:hypothetical protein